MGKNGAKDNVIDLGGWGFKRVKNGLDEAQVASIINELTGQREALIQRTDHLDSLNKLAERTVTEADRLAEEMATEAIDRAKAEAAAIIAEAKAQAQQMMEEKRTEIITMANQEATIIKAETERKAGLLLGDKSKSIQLEIRDLAHGLYSRLVSELESLKQQVVALQVESEHRLSQPVEETSPVTMEADEVPSDSQELTQAINHESMDKVEAKAPVPDDLNTTTGEEKPGLELEILPPIDIMKILEIVTYLDSLPEVENTELVPDNERPSIIVSLREPIHLIPMLRALPEVAHITEEATDTAGAEGKLGKVQISLSEETVPREAR